MMLPVELTGIELDTSKAPDSSLNISNSSVEKGPAGVLGGL